MAATLVIGPNEWVAKNTVLFANMPGFIAKALKVYRTENGTYQVWTAPGSQFDDFNGIIAGRSYNFIMSAAGTFDDLGLPAGSSAGPLVPISVTAGTRTITIPNVVFTDTTKLYRSNINGEYLKPNWSYTVSGGNTTVTIASTEPVISNEEANPTAFQYQLN